MAPALWAQAMGSEPEDGVEIEEGGARGRRLAEAEAGPGWGVAGARRGEEVAWRVGWGGEEGRMGRGGGALGRRGEGVGVEGKEDVAAVLVVPGEKGIRRAGCGFRAGVSGGGLATTGRGVGRLTGGLVGGGLAGCGAGADEGLLGAEAEAEQGRLEGHEQEHGQLEDSGDVPAHDWQDRADGRRGQARWRLTSGGRPAMVGGMSTKVRSGVGIWLWLVWAGAGLWAAGVVAAGQGQGQGQAQVPNVVFVMADDMGYGDLGCYGQKEILTPRIDRLAAEGMRFTQVYSGSPVCAPARSVLMTGQHTGRTTVRGNSGLGGVRGPGGEAGRVPLRAEDVTVAEVLKGAGYVTGMTGKWGLGEPGTTGVPSLQGFDHWLGFLNQRRAHSYYPDYLWKGDEKFPLPGNEGGARGQWVHDLFTDFALDFIRAQAGGRFFLYVPYTVPHDKFEIPDLAPYGDRDWTEQEKIYAAMITRMDGDIGRMVDLLEELGLSENTIIFLCSDNGAANRYEGVFDSSGPLRGQKRDLYEGGIRVPMIVRWQGTVAAGAVSDAV